MRSAISPRLAISIFSNMRNIEWRAVSAPTRLRLRLRLPPPLAGEGGGGDMARIRRSLDQHQRRAVFDGRRVFDKNAREAARARRADLVHDLHRLDDQQGLTLADCIADTRER